MATHFHPLTIKEITKQTADAVVITFDVPDELANDFLFNAGQSLTLKAMVNGEELRRSYSICSAPHEKRLSVAVKKVFNGKFSSFANSQLQPGDILEALPPTGKFYSSGISQNKAHYLGFAAGSGITPVISIIKNILETEAGSSFALVYGNRRRSGILFFEELEALKNKYLHRLQLVHVLSGEPVDTILNAGRIDIEKMNLLKKLFSFNQFDHIFICGPGEMIASIQSFLLNDGISPERIHFELFSTTGTVSFQPKQATAFLKNILSHIHLIIDGRQMQFDFDGSQPNILDAALQHGADLPYSCKGGVCATCKSKLVDGEVTLANNYALDDNEIKQGFILTCQARPVTPSVTINFDLR